MTPKPPSRASAVPPQRRLFLSCVSHEFRAYRDVLAASLAQPGVELRRQEDFINAGRTTLEKISAYIETCDAVIHLVGLGTGAYPEPAHVQALLAAHPGLADTPGLGDLLQAPGLSYTQWEAWLSLYHGKPLALYRAADGAQRELGFVREPGQAQRQSLHWRQLLSRGWDRKEFMSPHDLSIEVLRALPTMVPGFSDNVRQGEFRDRNLLFAVLALQDDILSREDFVRVCSLWAGDTDQSIAALMAQEGMLTPQDQGLVEARLERKLRHRGGDLRQSLAECLGADIRQSLGGALDPATLASLPDRLAALGEMGLTPGSWRYRLTRTHGMGGLGVVSVAEDAALDRNVAVKQLRPERVLDPMAVERFVREARITGRLQHPNIVPVYELGLHPDDQIPFYAMRFVGHRTLRDAITQHHADKTSSASARNLRFRELLQSCLAVCNAVAFAHDQGVIHRDLKPANVMIGDFGEVILLDWGLAKRVDELEPSTGDDLEPLAPGMDLSQTQVGARLGSPAYMAPEQAAGHVHLHGPATDIYGLGVILYELLTGDVPFTGTSTDELLHSIQTRPLPPPRTVNPAAPAALSAVCCKALQKEPADRYATAKELADDIQHWLADEPVSVFKEGLVLRSQRLARKYPGTVAAMVATVLVGFTGLSAGLYFVSKERNKAVISSNLAARRLDEKRLALDQMLATFGDDKLKGQPGSQPVRKLFLEKGLAQYQSMLAEQTTEPAVVLRTGDALRELGLVTKELGEVDQSLAHLQKAVDLCRSAVAARPQDPAMKAGLGDALHELAQALFENQKYPEALPLVTESVDIFRALLKADPAKVDYKAKLGRSVARRASLLTAAEERKPLYDESVTLLREALALEPDNPSYMLYTARSISNRALGRADNSIETLNDYKEAEALAAKALRISPALPLGNSLRAVFTANAADLMARQGKVDEGLAYLDRVTEECRLHAAQNPAVLAGNTATLQLLNKRVFILQTAKRTEEVIKTYQEIIQLNDTLAQRDASNPTYAVASAEGLQYLAETYSGSKREPEALVQYEKIASQASQWMASHRTSSAMLSTLLRSLSSYGTFLVGAQRYDRSDSISQLAADLYSRHIASIAEPVEDIHFQYAKCLGVMIQTAQEQQDLSRAISLGEKYALPLKLDLFKDGENRREAVSVLVKLASLYADVGRNDEAIDLYSTCVTEAKRILGGDNASNWYAYQIVYGSYHRLALLYRKVGKDRHAFVMLRKHFEEAEPYVHGKTWTALLKETEVFSPATLARLWQEHDATFDKTGMKRFTIPVSFNGVPYPFNVYVAENWAFTADQFTWVEKCRGGVVSQEVRGSFERLYKIAKDNNVSFQELAVYALGTAAEEDKTMNEAPLLGIAEGVAEESSKVLPLLAKMKAEVQNSNGADAPRRALALKYIKLSEDAAQRNQTFIASSLLVDARKYLNLDSEGKPTAKTDKDLFTYVQHLESAVLATKGELEKAYALALQSLRGAPATSAPEATPPAGIQPFVLGWICAKMGRPFEAAIWYQQAIDRGHAFAARNLARVYLDKPEIDSALSPDMKKRVDSAWRGYAKELIAMGDKLRQSTTVTKITAYDAARAYALAARFLDAFHNPFVDGSFNEWPDCSKIALENLKIAVEKGFNEMDKLKNDPDLVILRRQPAFEALLKPKK